MITLLLSVVVVVLAVIWLSGKLIRPKVSLQSPPAIPILGHALHLVLNPHKYHLELEEWANKYDQAYELYIFNRRVVAIAEHDVIKHVLTNRPTHFRRTSLLEPIAHEVGIHGVFSAEGEDWRRQRKLTAPAFTPTQIRNHYESLAKVCERMKMKWKRKLQEEPSPESGVVVDVLPDLMNFTLDVISMIAFGYDLNSLENYSDIVDSLLMYMPVVHRRIASLFPYWKYFHLPIDRKFVGAQEKVQGLVNRMIAEYYENAKIDVKKKQRSFIQTILKARESEGDQLNDIEIFGNALTLLIAGQDTTANTLAWTMYYLSRNHEIQEKLYEEISQQEKSIDYPFLPANCENLPYCSAVIKESLRLRGPAPVIYVEAKEETTVPRQNGDSITLRKKDLIVCLTRVVQKQWVGKDGHKFLPSRWLDKELNLDGNKFIASLAFGGGPRLCPGRNLSLMESNMFLAMLCGEFIVRPAIAQTAEMDVSLAGTEDATIKENFAFTMGPENLSVRLFPRKK